MTLNSHQISLIRNALYDESRSLFELKQQAADEVNREKYNARAEEVYTLAEQLKDVNQLESK